MKWSWMMVLCGVFLVFLYACEDSELNKIIDEGQPIDISLLTTRMDGDLNNIDPDYEIKSVRILAFNSGTKLLKFNSGKINLPVTSQPITFRIMTGTYDFVFIANEHSASGNILTNKLDLWTVGSNKSLSMLDVETFPFDAFGSSKSIPATSIYPDVRVLGDQHLTYFDPETNQWITIDSNNIIPWEVEVERLGVRVDLNLTVNNSFVNQLNEIRFANIPDKVHFFRNKIMDNSVIYYESGYDDTYPLSAIPISDFTMTGPDSDNNYKYTLERIILPTSVFSQKEEKEKGISLHIPLSVDPTQPMKGILGQSIPNDYTSPRNIYYVITGKLDKSSLLLDVSAYDWEKETISGNVGKRMLNVDCLAASLGIDEKIRIHFWSNQPAVFVQPTGWFDSSGLHPYNINDVFGDLAGKEATNLYYDPLTGTGYIDVVFKEGFQSPGISSNEFRILLDACGLQREILIRFKS